MAGPTTKPEQYDYDLLSEAREAEVRWQQIRITQFGIVNQTTLTLAVAAIGFIVANRDITNYHMIPFTLSVLLGTACSCIRLADLQSYGSDCQKEATEREVLLQRPLPSRDRSEHSQVSRKRILDPSLWPARSIQSRHSGGCVLLLSTLLN